MSLQTRAQFFETHFLHSYVSEIGLRGERDPHQDLIHVLVLMGGLSNSHCMLTQYVFIAQMS
jgi:hypothetical protein